MQQAPRWCDPTPPLKHSYRQQEGWLREGHWEKSAWRTGGAILVAEASRGKLSSERLTSPPPHSAATVLEPI